LQFLEAIAVAIITKDYVPVDKLPCLSPMLACWLASEGHKEEVR